MKLYVTILSAMLLVVSAAHVVQAAPESRRDTSSLPITIKSNDLAADNKGKTAVFSGKVVASRGTSPSSATG